MITTTPVGPRLLLRRMHEIMAGPGSVQERLDRLSELIAQNMVAEVCSIYLARPGDVLELYSTRGLDARAVHRTRLRFGEGLVGHIAATGRPLAEADAQAHPSFSYRPETGEQIYHSFLGVPILRANRVTGALVVQNRTQRHYTEEEIETLQTVAMVLAELINAADFIDPGELPSRNLEAGVPLQLPGLSLIEGIAKGQAVFHEPRVQITKLIADDLAFERARLGKALDAIHVAIDRMLSSDVAVEGEHRDVIEAFRLFASDEGWHRRIDEAIQSGLSAEAAVERVQIEMRTRMWDVTNAYIRERMQDLDDLSNRLIRQLTGQHETAAEDEVPDDAILIARNMGPAELLDYDLGKIRAVALEEGSPTSHVVVVARGLGVPLVGRVQGLLDQVDPGDWVVVDGDLGQIHVRPAQDVLDAYDETIALRARRQADYAARRDDPAVSRDGVAVSLNINAGLLSDIANLETTGAAGVGLFRTELQFMVSPKFPRLPDQSAFYRTVLDAAADRPVVFRTLDIGGDKIVPYLPRRREENPALGWRAIRLALDRPALLRYQLRALLYGAAGRELSVMFPMVADVREYEAATALLDRELARMRALGRDEPSIVKVGSMIEVPSLAWQLDALIPLVDFVSVGSNDLFQFFFASDRANPQLASRFDTLSPSLLSFLRSIVRTCDEAGMPVSVCGEMAGRPLEAMALIGLGFRALSMSPAAVGPVKMMLRSLDVVALATFMEGLYRRRDRSLRALLENFARENRVII